MNLADKTGLDSFVDIFKTLHETGNLKELYLTGTGIKNIKAKLESTSIPWGNNSESKPALQCDS